MSAIHRAHPRGARAWSVRPSPRLRGSREPKLPSPAPAARPLPQAGEAKTLASVAGAAPFSLPGALSAAASGGGKSPSGARAGCTRVRCQYRDVLSANLRSRLRSRWAWMPNDRGREGALSLGYFSLGKQREVTRSPGWRAEKHKDVSRSSRQRQKDKNKQQNSRATRASETSSPAAARPAAASAVPSRHWADPASPPRRTTSTSAH